MLVQKTSTPTKPKLTYVLKKLPMFGRSDNLEFKNYFEYPSQQEFDQIVDKKAVKVLSFDVYASPNGMNIGGIKVNLTED